MHQQIKLVVVDIDGCLLPTGSQAIDLSVADRVRKHNRLSLKDPWIPPVTLCSGRPEPYVELLMKFIEGHTPAIFEWGAGLYLPDSYDFIYNDIFTDDVRESKQAIENLIRRNVGRKQGARIQPGKEVAITIYPRQGMPSYVLYAELKKVLADFEAARTYSMHCTRTHVDMLPVGLDKGVGLKSLANLLGVNVLQVAGIGDDETDLSFLKVAGFSACPDNSQPEVKAIVDYVSPYRNGKGVIDILERLTEQ